MFTVHQFGGTRFVIFSNDHAPAHIDVVKPDAEAKVQLSGANGLELIWQYGFGPGEMRRIMVEVLKERPRLLQRWSEIHG